MHFRSRRYIGERGPLACPLPLYLPSCAQAKLSRDWYLFQLYVIMVQMEEFEV